MEHAETPSMVESAAMQVLSVVRALYQNMLDEMPRDGHLHFRHDLAYETNVELHRGRVMIASVHKDVLRV
jgi:hypothetical protein